MIQPMACLSILGTMRSTPLRALEVLLNLPPLVVITIGKAARTIHRLKTVLLSEVLVLNAPSLSRETGVAQDLSFLMILDALLSVKKLNSGFVVSIPESNSWLRSVAQRM